MYEITNINNITHNITNHIFVLFINTHDPNPTAVITGKDQYIGTDIDNTFLL